MRTAPPPTQITTQCSTHYGVNHSLTFRAIVQGADTVRFAGWRGKLYLAPRDSERLRESSMPDYANISYETKGRLAYVPINRPDRRNAIDPNTSRELRDAFEAFKSDDNVWVAILTGSGEQAFSAGADLVAMAEAFAGGAQGPRYDG